MDVYEALYTTRAMRRVKPDPIPTHVQARIVDAAIRAPSGGNNQNWRFLLVDDPGLRGALGPIYRECVDELFGEAYAPRLAAARATPDDPRSVATMKLYRSVWYQANHWERIPLLLFAYAKGERGGSSIYPAVWNAMLAARAEGIGSTLTTILATKPAVNTLLGVPEGEEWRQFACVTLGYPLGRFDIAARRPAHEVAARNGWNGELGFTVEHPLWSSDAD